MNIANFPLEIAPFTEVEFTIFIFEKHRKCKGVVQPSPRPLLGCVLINYEVWIEPEFDTRLVGDDRIYRSAVQLQADKVRPLNLAGHGKDSKLIQSRLALYFDPIPENDIPTKRVLGGDENTSDGYVKNHAHGWIEPHPVRRNRKNGEVWEGVQYWLHWEEKGGKKRSRYIPKGRYSDVEQSVYELRKPIEETLKLLEKKK